MGRNHKNAISVAIELHAEGKNALCRGDIWSQIYAALDDSACATSYGGDQLASRVNQTKLLECTGTVIVRFTPVHTFTTVYTSTERGMCMLMRTSATVHCTGCVYAQPAPASQHHIQLLSPPRTAWYMSEMLTLSQRYNISNAKLQVDFWVKALAKLHIEGACRAETPIRCQSCCVKPTGGYYEGCVEANCQTDCANNLYQYAEVQAKAWSESAVRTQTANCNLTVADSWTAYKRPFTNFTVRTRSILFSLLKRQI